VGCELWLFPVPRKAGNMDCTFCLDCIMPARTTTSGDRPRAGFRLWRDPYRSGIGRFSRRYDWSPWSCSSRSAPSSNAFAMIGPCTRCRRS